MPVVNIRDGDGNIKESVNIPINSSNSGGGGNYAPANAVVDVSSLCEWEDAHYTEHESIFQQWRWEKRIDGTFTLEGINYDVCCYNIEGVEEMFDGQDEDEAIVSQYDETMPFDLFDCECSWYIENDDDDILNDTLRIDITPTFEFQGPPDGLYTEIAITRETLQRMREYAAEWGHCSITGRLHITITGKWRVDE